MSPAGEGLGREGYPPSQPLPTAPVLNIANLLTLIRLALVPVFLAALFTDGGYEPQWRWIAAGIFVLAAVTDHIDGALARKHALITDFGKIADPIADKALTGSALIGLSILAELPWWITAVILLRELAITLLRFWIIRYQVLPANRGGKAKTLTQIVAITLYVVPLSAMWEPMRWITMGMALLLTVFTAVDYVAQAVRIRRSGNA